MGKTRECAVFALIEEDTILAKHGVHPLEVESCLVPRPSHCGTAHKYLGNKKSCISVNSPFQKLEGSSSDSRCSTKFSPIRGNFLRMASRKRESTVGIKLSASTYRYLLPACAASTYASSSCPPAQVVRQQTK